MIDTHLSYLRELILCLFFRNFPRQNTVLSVWSKYTYCVFNLWGSNPTCHCHDKGPGYKISKLVYCSISHRIRSYREIKWRTMRRWHCYFSSCIICYCWWYPRDCSGGWIQVRVDINIWCEVSDDWWLYI